ncbi:hypothetical protein HDZ31DRAFT_47082, partial [Schizophyllum fasciatum]
IFLVWLLPSFALKRPGAALCSRCKVDLRRGRRVPSRSKTLPAGASVCVSPPAKGGHHAAHAHAHRSPRPKTHNRSNSGHHVLTHRAIADKSASGACMPRTTSEVPIRKSSPRTARQFASRNDPAFNDPFAGAKSSERINVPKVSSSPSLQIFRDVTKLSAGKDSSDREASPGRKLMTGSAALNASIASAFDASVTIPVKAAKSSLASAGKASLASANKASMRLSNFAKLQRINPLAPSPLPTPSLQDSPSSILFPTSATAVLSESPTSITQDLPASACGAGAPFVGVVPPTPELFSAETFEDGSVAPSVKGSVSLSECRSPGSSANQLYVDTGDAGSKRNSI